MKLTSYTDYSLRVLIYLSMKKEDELATIQEISDAYQISRNHLMKVVYELSQNGYVQSIRGRNGGLRLAKLAEEINIGEVIQLMESDFHIVECFNTQENACILSPMCQLKGILNEALQVFLQVLHQYTLRDLIHNREDLQQLLLQNK